MNSDISSIKNALTKLSEIFDLMDEKGFGTAKYIPDHTSEEIFRLNLISFLLYIADADHVIEEEEAEMINELMDQTLTKRDYAELAKQTGISDESFCENVPVIFRTLADVCNRLMVHDFLKPYIVEDSDSADESHSDLSDENRQLFSDAESEGDSDTDDDADPEGSLSNTDNQSFAILTYEIFCASGLAVMVSDQHMKQSEFDRISAYMQMIYDYLNNALVRGFASRPPQEIFNKIMTAADGSSIQDKLEPDTAADSLRAEAAKDPNREKTLDELLDEMNSLIGLDEVKTDLLSLINLVRIKSLRQAKGLPMPPISLHLVFSGNPGTGKTTVARLLAKIYQKLGILSKGQLIEVDRSNLIAGYVGQTALKVQDVIESALGGVLFIDEAYALTPENASNDYGMEAIDTLVKGMEDHRDDLIVIAAGYTEPMKRFIAANPGLKSRFNKFIHFRDYSPEELMQIFARFCKTSGYRPTIPALLFVRDYFTECLKEPPENFANAREARNLFEFAIARQASRLITESDLSKETLTLLTRDDVSGKVNRTGQNELLTESIMASLNVKRRQGIEERFLPVTLEEMEFSPRCRNALGNRDIYTVNDILDFLDTGKKLTEIENMSNANATEVTNGLKLLGWNG